KGQELMITAQLHAADLVRLIAKKAYEAGAKNVHIDWQDEVLSRLKYELAPSEVFSEFPPWKAAERTELAKSGAAFISISSQDPDLLNGIDSERIADAQRSSGMALKEFYTYILAEKVSWTVISAAGEGWAKKVFPNESTER